MANITAELNAILTATYGEEIRTAIYDALVAINKEVTAATSTANSAISSAENILSTANVGKSTGGANQTGDLWQRVNWLYQTIGDPKGSDANSYTNTLWGAMRFTAVQLGRSTDTANRIGTSVWSQVRYLQNTVGNPQQTTAGNYTNSLWEGMRRVALYLGNPTDGAGVTSTAWGRIKWLVQTVGDPNGTDANSYKNTLWGAVRYTAAQLGTSTVAPDANGTTVWSRARYAVTRANEAYALANR